MIKTDLLKRYETFTEPTPKTVDVLIVKPPILENDELIRDDSWNDSFSKGTPVWPQVELAQLAAMLTPDYRVALIDAAAQQLTWPEFEAIIQQKRPRYYITKLENVGSTNELFGLRLAHSLGIKTIAFGRKLGGRLKETGKLPHSVDYVLYGEPELTLRELIDHLEFAAGRWTEDKAEPMAWSRLVSLFQTTTPGWQPTWRKRSRSQPNSLDAIQGLVWWNNGELVINPERSLIPYIDDLPLPHHHLLPVKAYRLPIFDDACLSVVTSRNDYALKSDFNEQHEHIRFRSAESIMDELWLLYDLGVNTVYMAASIFTVKREQIINLCKLVIEEELPLKWACRSKIDYVDGELLVLMAQAGCQSISWDLMSTRSGGNGFAEKVPEVLQLARKAGIRNYGSFTIGLPGETKETIKRTIALAKSLPLDLAFFNRPNLNTSAIIEGEEQMTDLADDSTVDQLGNLQASELEYWQKRAFRDWALRRNPFWIMSKGVGLWARFRNVSDVTPYVVG